MEIPKSWTFQTEEIASNFDSHVRTQLPWYDQLTDLVVMIAKNYMPNNALCYDIGASTGNLSAILKETIQNRHIKWIAIDNAKSMKKYYRGAGKVKIIDAIKYPYKPFNLAICFLSIMFFSIEIRQDWLMNMVKLIKRGGAIIIVDKEAPIGGNLSTSLHRFVMSNKMKQGVNSQDILDKEFSLCGIQNPLSKDFFKNITDNKISITEVFRFGDFAGWVIERQ